MKYFENNNVKIVAFEEKHIACVHHWINNEEINSNMGSRFPIGRDDQEKWYDSYKKDDTKKKLIIISNNEEVGMVSLFDIDYKNQNSEIGVYIDPNNRHKSYAKDAIAMILNFAFNEMNMNKIYALIYDFNTSSIKLFKSLGFSYESTDKEAVYSKGDFIDIEKYSIFKRDIRL
jgi:UDP-4-amino-4,6-dideoxy-N-acetyl-beta-L-altrosamine N-acetyltransferase